MEKFRFYLGFFFGFLTTAYALVPLNSSCFEREKSFALMKTAENLLTEAKISFPSCKNQTDCGKQKSLAYIDISKNLLSDAIKIFPNCQLDSKPFVRDKKHKDCSGLFEDGFDKSGVYTIWPRGPFTILEVYCDMETDKGGWTVIQRRGKFSVQQDFYQDWETYKNGFGNITEEFWLGNENIRVLCLKGCEIRFDLQDAKGLKGFANYENFNMTGSKYRLAISGYNGNVGDRMDIHNNADFVTKDESSGINTIELRGGWWYRDRKTFFNTNLNGIYNPGKSGEENIIWYDWRRTEGLAAVEIKVRPKKA